MGKSEQKNETPIEQPKLPVSDLALKNGLTFHVAKTDKKTGKVIYLRQVPAHDSVYKAPHLQADVLHGWSKSERLTSQETQLTEVDYLAAIEAAKTGKTHKPANMRDVDNERTAKIASRAAAEKGA